MFYKPFYLKENKNLIIVINCVIYIYTLFNNMLKKNKIKQFKNFYEKINKKIFF